MQSPSSVDLSEENILGTLWAQLLLQFSTDCFETFQMFLHGMKMCMCFGYNPSIIFFSKCIDSGYLVGATPLTVFHHLFWNIAGVFSMEWRCACGFCTKLWLFFSLFLRCELSLFFLHEMLSKCIDNGYLVSATPLLQFSFSCFQTLQMKCYRSV